MNSRERYIMALTGGTPDRVPVGDYLFSLKLQKQMLGYTTELYDPVSQIELAHRVEVDCAWVPIDGFCGLEDNAHAVGTTYQDEWGVTYIKNGWPIMAQVDTPIKSRADWEKYRMPAVSAPHRLKSLSLARKANPHHIAIQAGLLGPFTMMYWYLMDLETLALVTYDDPQLVHEMCDAFVNWALGSAEKSLEVGGVDAFSISDDWGGTTALLMSPRQLREFFLPAFGKLVKGLKKLGKPVIMHNDGHIWTMLDELVDTGINGFHPVERAAGGDLAYVKNRYRGRLCPIGNVDNKQVMSTGSTDDVRREVVECLGMGKPGGGYIISTDHSIHDGMPLENIRTYIQTAHEHGAY